MEEASAILSEQQDEEQNPDVDPIVPQPVDYSALSVKQLEQEAKKQRTHVQKDAFIAQLLALLSRQSAASDGASKTSAADKPAEPAPSSEKTFVVEDVSKFKRKHDGVEQVLVKWKGFPIEEMTWEARTDELTRSNVGGSFFQPSDTSYKKFCERVGIDAPCKAIGKKDKARCKEQKAAQGEPDDMCTSSETTTTDEESEEVEESETTEEGSDKVKEDEKEEGEKEEGEKEEESEGEEEEEEEESKEKEESEGEQKSQKGQKFAEIPTPSVSDDEKVTVESVTE